jgi:hypothetical protein
MTDATSQKIAAFRNFATQLAGQVVEQLCQEYEREVSVMWNDLVQYRNELGRVAELLGTQLQRERSLHEMLEGMAGHHANIANSAQMAAQQSPNAKHLHAMVDQIMGEHSHHVNSTLQGVSQAHAVAQSHAQNAKQLQEPLISAENEYNRIMNLLSQPMIPTAAPEPVRVQAPMTSRTPPMTPAAPPRMSTSMSVSAQPAPAAVGPQMSVGYAGHVVTQQTYRAAPAQYAAPAPVAGAPMQMLPQAVIVQR